MTLPQDWREFIELLNSNGVEYVVVGGHAVGFHGYPRFTGDIDFFVRATPENARRIVSALGAFGFPGADDLESTFNEVDKVVQIGRPPNRIDLLTGLSGIDYDEASRDALDASLGGVPVRIIGRSALLKNKRSTGRTKDIADAEEIDRTTDSNSS